ncbi:MAG: hypothetical protein Q7J70_05520 [Thermodesulfovibrionales bacterium]|nr:hypothetical protein [Thermodesulfovibrionales bacterium]
MLEAESAKKEKPKAENFSGAIILKRKTAIAHRRRRAKFAFLKRTSLQFTPLESLSLPNRVGVLGKIGVKMLESSILCHTKA